MKELNIASIIAKKRHEKGITQDQLAEYIGVSKASVSKWETGQSYPDITFLPRIAMYFNISIDELIGYKPQMTKEDINKLYKKLSTDFAKNNFEDVYNLCKEYIKKYYSCYELLIKIASLYINHFMISTDINIQKEMIDSAIQLVIRVKEESEDVRLINEAIQMESAIYLMNGQADKLLDLLGEDIQAIFPKEALIASAYQMQGNIEKAEEVFQIVDYQELIMLLSNSSQEIMINIDKKEKAEEIIKRTTKVIELFNFDKMHLNVAASIYISSAVFYVRHEDKEKAIYYLNKYVKSAQNEEIYELHTDDYFNLIGPWLKENTTLPRDKKIIKKSILESVKNNPEFKCLEELDQYKIIINKLENL